MNSTLILVVPNLVGDFIVCIDASLEGIGVVLMEDGRAISYESCKIKDHELNYLTHDLELVVVFHSLVIWRHFLLGNHFELHSDHHSLHYIFM